MILSVAQIILCNSLLVKHEMLLHIYTVALFQHKPYTDKFKKILCRNIRHIIAKRAVLAFIVIFSIMRFLFEWVMPEYDL